MRGRLLVGVFVLGLVAIGVAAAGLNRNWSDHANGSQEVPPRATQGQAQAIFHLSKDGSSLSYKVIASNIENVFMSHIHMAGPGVNGPIVVWLYPSTAPMPGPFGAGRTNGVLAEGTITAANLVGLTFTVGGFPPDFGLDAIVAAIVGAIAISIVGTIVHLVVPER